MTFKLEADDLWQYNVYVIRRVPAFRLIFVIRLLLMPLVVSALYAFLFKGWLLGILIFLGVEVIWMPFVFWSNKRYNLKVLNNRPGVFDRQTVSIAAEGVRQKASNSETLMAWRSFVELAEHPKFLVFFMDKRYGVIIPIRAFPCPEESHQFYRTATAFWQGMPAPTSPEPSTSWPPPPQMLKPS